MVVPEDHNGTEEELLSPNGGGSCCEVIMHRLHVWKHDDVDASNPVHSCLCERIIDVIVYGT